MANAATLKSATPHAASQFHAADAGSLASFTYAMLSHPGRVRHANQDAVAAAHELSAFVVCDGVGGAAGGEIASQLAVESFLGALRLSGHSPLTPLNDNAAPTRLHQAVLAANQAVFQRAQRTHSLRGMATTLVAALLDPAGTTPNDALTSHPSASCPTLWLAHAGDSRAYRLRRGALELLTRDHSLVEEQIHAGIISRLDALRSPVRNVITRAVGAATAVEPEIASHAIEPGDFYLLASDGLTRELTDPAIARILTTTLGTDRAEPSERTASLEDAVHALIDATNDHGGRDNITVLLLACG